MCEIVDFIDPMIGIIWRSWNSWISGSGDMANPGILGSSRRGSKNDLFRQNLGFGLRSGIWPLGTEFRVLRSNSGKSGVPPLGSENRQIWRPGTLKSRILPLFPKMTYRPLLNYEAVH